MDQKVKGRSGLYKIASRTGESQDWAKNLPMDKEIKEMVNINKRKQT